MKRTNRRDFIKTGISTSLFTSGLLQPTLSAAGKRKRRRPNILWIMMDDGRADALGCYGRTWAKTPHMDAIARQGVRFASAIVQNPVCVPSRKSMKSSQYPHTLGVIAMGKPAGTRPPYLKKAKHHYPNLMNRWKDVGIQPVNVGKRHAYRKDWDHRGDVPPTFDVLGRPRNKTARDRLAKTGSRYPEVITKTHKWAIGGTIPLKPQETSTWKLGDLALETLEELIARDEPFFLRVSFHAPHVPCRVPASYMIDPSKITLPLPTDEELKNKPRFERENLHVYSGCPDLTNEQVGIARGTYYGMVSLVDTQVGRLTRCLEEAGVVDNTIIAINSDQGFQLGEHGLWKKRVMYEQNVCVPLIVSCPDRLPSGKVTREPVEMVDFVPTLMELSELDVPDSVRGRSLCPLIRGEAKKWRPACFCEIDHSMSMYKELRQGTGRRVMVRTKDYKMIYFHDERVPDKDGALYRLQKDPHEKENLYGRDEYKPIIHRLEDLVEKWDQTG